MRLTRRQMLYASGSALSLPGLAGLQPTLSGAAQTPVSTAGQQVNAVLLEFASCIPLALVSDNAIEGHELLTFGDFALRLESVGIDPSGIADPDERTKTFIGATMPVIAGDLMTATLRSEDPVALFGWSLVDIAQIAFVMSSEGMLTVLRGDFDLDLLHAAWLSQGYQPVDIEGVGAYSLGPDRQFDLSTEFGRLTLGSAANVALLQDGLLLYAPSLSALTDMIGAHSGSVRSLGADPIVQTVVNSVDVPLSGASVLPSGAFVASIPPNFGPEDIPEPGPIPLMGLIGFFSGDTIPESDIAASEADIPPSGSTMVSSRHFLTPEEAELAARRSLMTLETQSSDRTGQPWTEVFAGWHISIDRETDTVLTEIDLYANEGIWLQLFYSRDAWFLYG